MSQDPTDPGVNEVRCPECGEHYHTLRRPDLDHDGWLVWECGPCRVQVAIRRVERTDKREDR